MFAPRFAGLDFPGASVPLIFAIARNAQSKLEILEGWIAARIASAVAHLNALIFRSACVPNQTRVVAMELLVGSFHERACFLAVCIPVVDALFEALLHRWRFRGDILARVALYRANLLHKHVAA